MSRATTSSHRLSVVSYEQREQVVADDLLDVGLRQLLDAVGEVAGHDVALGVRPVGAHEHAVDADELGETDDVLLRERRDVDVLLEHVRRQILHGLTERLDATLEQRARVVDHVQGVRGPRATQLDAGDLHVREAAEQVAEHEGDGELEDPAVGVERRRQRRVVAGVGERLAPHLVERLAVPRRAAVAVVRGERAALVHQRPEPVPRRVGGRTPVGRPGTDRHRLDALVQQELELVGREVGVEHRDVRRRVEAVLVRVAPVLLQPEVEGVEDLVGHRHVVVHEPLDAVAERREEQALLHVLLVDHVDARVVHPVALGELLELAVRLLHVVERDAGHAAAALLQLLQPRVERARRGDRVERRVRHAGVGEADHRRAEHHVPALALADPADVALDVLVAVTDERVLGLVVVVVRVDEHVVGHDAFLQDGNDSLVQRGEPYQWHRAVRPLTPPP